MEIDVRSGGTVASIRYSDTHSLWGAPGTDITVRQDNGPQIVLCSPAEVDALIRALQAVKKLW